MKELIRNYIVDFVRKYENSGKIVTKYREPLVGFADANHPDILNIRKYTFKGHLMPNDVLEDASIIIAYFIPFKEEVVLTNMEGEEVSKEWTVAYEETNEMFTKLNDFVISKIEEMGYKAAVCKEATKFSKDILKSKWSHRHIAKVAGLGTFGLNNMLITDEGCCGRYYTIVTNLPVIPDEPLKEENCLYKRNGSCGVCVKRCFSGALSEEKFDRFKCHDTCYHNYENYEKKYGHIKWQLGEPRGGSEVCGKCLVNLPCSFKRP